MKKSTYLFSTLTVVFIAAMLISFVPQDKQPSKWDVPAEYANMKNPKAADQSSIDAGKALYMRNCASCHGRTGLGDGPKARGLKTFAGDFSAEAYQKQSDGSFFYKTKFGKDEMPAYKGKIEDEDIWHMVNYMRTFKK